MNENQSVLAYSIPDACKALGIGRTTLYRLISEDRIEALQLDGRTVIPAEPLRAFLAKLPPAKIRRAPATTSRP